MDIMLDIVDLAIIISAGSWYSAKYTFRELQMNLPVRFLVTLINIFRSNVNNS